MYLKSSTIIHFSFHSASQWQKLNVQHAVALTILYIEPRPTLMDPI